MHLQILKNKNISKNQSLGKKEILIKLQKGLEINKNANLKPKIINAGEKKISQVNIPASNVKKQVQMQAYRHSLLKNKRLSNNQQMSSKTGGNHANVPLLQNNWVVNQGLIAHINNQKNLHFEFPWPVDLLPIFAISIRPERINRPWKFKM